MNLKHLIFGILILTSCTGASQKIPRVPVLDSEFWKIGNNPDLGDLMPEGDRSPEVVDHGFVRAKNGMWQLWACIRHTKVGRILYRWEGKSLNQLNWTPKGVAMRADRNYGESIGPQERMQAPFFFQVGETYYLYYGGGESQYTSADSLDALYQICLATSEDGLHFTRYRNTEGQSRLFTGPGKDRDPMILKRDNTYYCYYSCTVEQNTRGFIVCRTSGDLLNWSEYTIVCEGGGGGYGPWSAECPYVVNMDGYYYLFRTQTYIPPVTHVYRSTDPLAFGLHDDSKKITVLEVAAPEIIEDDGQYYISSTADYNGIRLAKLRWDIVKK